MKFSEKCGQGKRGVYDVCRRTDAESEEIVAELVYGFLLPEVQKQTMHDKGKWTGCK